MFELCGWIGCFLLAICALPQTLKSIKDRHSHGMSWGSILLWLFGEAFGLVYVASLASLPLIFNYGLNVILLTIILWYKVFPKYKENEYKKI